MTQIDVLKENIRLVNKDMGKEKDSISLIMRKCETKQEGDGIISCE